MQSDMNDFYGTQTVYQAVAFCPVRSHINIYTRVFLKKRNRQPPGMVTIIIHKRFKCRPTICRLHLGYPTQNV